jgi:uncharacterized protein (TIGR00725 family)
MKTAPTLAEVTIGVMGSGTDGHDEVASEIGGLLAELGVNLLTGGGAGVMVSVSRAFTQARRRRGICIGIIPSLSEDERDRPRPGYPNPFVELAIHTHLPHSGARGKDVLSRNHINVLSCAGVIALPGGEGTASEASLALDYHKPVLAYAREMRLLALFPESVPRTSSLADVEAFVRHLRDITKRGRKLSNR